jgi:hypothetical protein
MLVDRGPSSVPQKGIPYLSPEGFPYRVFASAHAELVRNATKLNHDDAVTLVISTYLSAAVFVTPRKLASMFRLLFTESEMNDAFAVLECGKSLTRTSKFVVSI